MKHNIDKYLSDINLSLITYKKVPNVHVLEQYDFEALDDENKIINGSIFYSFAQIDINFKAKNGINHLYSCVIKHSSINDCVIQNTHSILENGNQKVIDIITRENIPAQEYFNFKKLDKSNNKTKVLAMC